MKRTLAPAIVAFAVLSTTSLAAPLLLAKDGRSGYRIVRPDGRPAHYDADKEVLSSPVSVGSVGGFYAVGGTRIKLLDILFLLAVLGGVAVPVGHMTMRRLLRKDR